MTCGCAFAGYGFGRVTKILLRATRSRKSVPRLQGDSALTVVSAYCDDVRPDLPAAKGIAPLTVHRLSDRNRRHSDLPEARPGS
jgi:hypothetical protein